MAHAGGARSCQLQICTIRGRSPRRCGRGCARESALDVGWHGFPESSAVKRSAARPPRLPASHGASWRRTGGGGSGGSDPRFFAAGAPRGRTKVAAKVAALCPPCGEVALTTVIPGGKAIEPARRPAPGTAEPGSGEETDLSSPTGHDGYLEDRGLYPRCPTRGTSRLLAGRGFRAESIRSDSTIDASIHGQEGPPKSDSKRWV